MKDSSKAVLAFLAENGPAYNGAISRGTGLNETTVMGCTTALRKVGLVIKGVNGWELTIKGQAYRPPLRDEPMPAGETASVPVTRSLEDRVSELERDALAAQEENAQIVRELQALREAFEALADTEE